MPKIQETKGTSSIAIPKEIMELKGWIKGQKLLAFINERDRLEFKEGK